jgi:hypothetical protein
MRTHAPIRALIRLVGAGLAVLVAGGWAAVAQPAVPGSIKVGALFDTTGPTSDVGVDYSRGGRWTTSATSTRWKAGSGGR